MHVVVIGYGFDGRGIACELAAADDFLSHDDA
jgi:S-adenosylhomocysteine hydrolase